jgi:1-aminocyclopropane-1-carboxylate deaminase/D-cysteine desulfhydrase-like pyridoxal-dependent ACC family enzyme
LGAPAICDDIAAAGAAQSFHVFVGGSALLAALVGAALWFALERAAKGSWLLRTLAGAGLAAGAGMALVATHPIATEAQRSLMESPACMHHFWLGAQGPLGQGLMLGLLPAGLLALLAIAAARRLV